MEHSKNKPSRPAQISLLLRLAAGAYLIYLAFDLVKEAISYSGPRQLILIFCIVLFLAAGLILGGFTLKKLIRGEFIRYGQEE